MPVRGILFDFDGTLTRPGSLDFGAIRQALGCPSGVPILEYLAALEAGERRMRMEVLERMEDEAAKRSEPNEGSIDLLCWLKGRSIPFGVVTRNGGRSVRIALAGFHPLTPADFAVIVTRDDAPPKPHPDGLLLAARRMGLHPADVAFVGDYRFDVLAGSAAGMVTVLLTNALPSPLLPEDPPPRYCFGRVTEVRGLFTDFSSPTP